MRCEDGIAVWSEKPQSVVLEYHDMRVRVFASEFWDWFKGRAVPAF